jgi:ribonuclease HI
MKKKQRYYVVWSGVTPGIYNSWTDCQLQVKGYEHAQYKAFDTRAEAEAAMASSPWKYMKKKADSTVRPLQLPANFDTNCIAVDAACSGNPGQMEYRGVYLLTGLQLFHFGPIYGTNNIGEFLAIVHALAMLQQQGKTLTIYSDSRNAIAWIKAGKCRTKLPHTAKSNEVYTMITRAEQWLASNRSHCPVCKWDTEHWGEIPADFGRK